MAHVAAYGIKCSLLQITKFSKLCDLYSTMQHALIEMLLRFALLSVTVLLKHYYLITWRHSTNMTPYRRVHTAALVVSI